ncbi:MAG: cobalamin-dependent protein [Acidobacteriia bacterium]|nr:cobalamin-dependent protein [Terriglobia bacterium]
MKVLLISANTERLNMVTIPLGLGLVAAATRAAGHEVAFLDLLRETETRGVVRRALAAFAPGVIGISVRNIDDQCQANPRFLLEPVREVVDECRVGSRAPIVLGGAGYSIFPREALAFLGADYGVAGDGEAAFVALIERLAAGDSPSDLQGVYTASGPPRISRAQARDLDVLPLWDDALAPAANDDLWIPVQSRRGCPNDCSYCSTSRVQGRRIRRRSPRRVVETVARLSRTGHRRFYFVDNSFNIPERHALELCAALAALDPPVIWRCILYPERVREALVRAMAAAGCCEVSLGFESGCSRILRELNKRFTPGDVRRTSDLLAAHGIRRFGFLLLGGPGETRESVEESLTFARSLHLDDLRITVGIRIYPGTPLARRAAAEGVIGSEDDLLRPRFYLAPGLEPWIHARLGAGL